MRRSAINDRQPGTDGKRCSPASRSPHCSAGLPQDSRNGVLQSPTKPMQGKQLRLILIIVLAGLFGSITACRQDAGVSPATPAKQEDLSVPAFLRDVSPETAQAMVRKGSGEILPDLYQ